MVPDAALAGLLRDGELPNPFYKPYPQADKYQTAGHRPASVMAAPAGHAVALHAAGRSRSAAAQKKGLALQLAGAPPGTAPRTSRGARRAQAPAPPEQRRKRAIVQKPGDSGVSPADKQARPSARPRGRPSDPQSREGSECILKTILLCRFICCLLNQGASFLI